MTNINSERVKFYDQQKNRLVYLDKKASEQFWDDHWNAQNLYSLSNYPPKHRWLIGITKKYIKEGGRVLEGGCGLGDKVRALSLAGFDAIGIDYAENTVRWANENWKTVKILKGDVRDLEIEPLSLDGYWSLGVIEHFYDGYEGILSEMERVMKPGGYVFCTIPAMTYLRKLKAKKGFYPSWNENTNKNNFYQFALDPEIVISDFNKFGFGLVKIQGVDTINGLQEEASYIKHIVKIVKKMPFGIASKMNFLADPAIGLYFGHMVLLVLKKS